MSIFDFLTTTEFMCLFVLVCLLIQHRMSFISLKIQDIMESLGLSLPCTLLTRVYARLEMTFLLKSY